MITNFARTATGTKLHNDYGGSMTSCGCRVRCSVKLTIEQLKKSTILCPKCFPDQKWLACLNEAAEKLEAEGKPVRVTEKMLSGYVSERMNPLVEEIAEKLYSQSA